MAALLIGIQPGDEVIIPTFTFVSTANAFALRGAQPVFCDIRPDTLNMDEEAVSALITDRTKAIVPVHYAGVGCEMDAILEAANRRGIAIVEDNAHGLFGAADGHPLGTRAPLSTLSFHETKNVTCGEGGALVINDPRFVERAEIIREKGTNRSRFFRGMVDKYTWIDVGSSYLLSDVNAAILMAQLEHREAIQTRRRRTATRYRDGLTAWADSRGYSMPHRDPDAGSPDHLFPLLMPDLDVRTRFLAHTRAGGVATTFHYIPLHSSPAGQRYGHAPFGAPNAVSVSERLIRLPQFSDIDDSEVDTVIDVTRGFEG
jgi:dTDP-4-amino-4,6-dideoxygalactose transaminase